MIKKQIPVENKITRKQGFLKGKKLEGYTGVRVWGVLWKGVSTEERVGELERQAEVPEA